MRSHKEPILSDVALCGWAGPAEAPSPSGITVHSSRRASLALSPSDYPSLCLYERAWFGDFVPKARSAPWDDSAAPLAFAWRMGPREGGVLWVRCFAFESVMLASLRMHHEFGMTFARAPLDPVNARFYLRAAHAANFAARTGRAWKNLDETMHPGVRPAFFDACRSLAEALCHACVAVDAADSEENADQAARWSAISDLCSRAASEAESARVEHYGVVQALRRVESGAAAEACRSTAELAAEMDDFTTAEAMQARCVEIMETFPTEGMERERPRLAVLGAAVASRRRSGQKVVSAVTVPPPMNLPDLSLGAGDYPPQDDSN